MPVVEKWDALAQSGYVGFCKGCGKTIFTKHEEEIDAWIRTHKCQSQDPWKLREEYLRRRRVFLETLWNKLWVHESTPNVSYTGHEVHNEKRALLTRVQDLFTQIFEETLEI